MVATNTAVAQQAYQAPQAQQGYFAPSIAIEKPTEAALVSVWDRRRPEYDAVGMRMGSFTVLPSVELSTAHDDNIYATKSQTVSDWVGKVRPEIRMKSNWNSHAFEAYGMVEGIWHDKTSDNDRTNANVGLRGSLDVNRDTRIRYFGDWTRDHEDRSVTGLFNSTAIGLLDSPVQLDKVGGGIGIDQRLNHTTFSLTGSYNNISYQDSTSGGAKIDQSYRDVDTYSARLRIGYDVGHSAQAYVEGGYERRDFDLAAFSGDSQRVVVGLSGQVTRLISGDVYTGYEHRNYDTSAISSTDNWIYGGALTWYASNLVTVSTYGERGINESTFGQLGTFVQSRIGARVDYEAMRNVILTGRIGYEWDQYNQVNREDQVLAAGVTATYLLNRNASVALDYRFTDRTSNFSDLEYSRNVVGATLRLQY
jgi:hypothetical protein